MSSTETARGPSPELRAAAYHFFVFGSTGVASAYLAIWLSGKGLGSEQIGIINALPILLMLAVNVFVGRLADRASDWRTTIIVLSLIAGVAPLGFFFVSEFWGLLLIWTITALPGGALVPVIDAATLRLTQRRGSDFGFVRAWGTVGYMVTAALTGAVIGWLGAIAFVPLFVILSLLRAGFAFPLPRFRAPPVADVPVRTASSIRLVDLMKPWFLLPCIAFALIQSTHMFLGTMGALVWKIDGVPEGVIGPLIAVSAAAEAGMMFAWRKVGGHMSARVMLIIACAVAVVRWAAMAFNPPIAVLFGLQLLHGITLTFSYFGIMHFIANWAPEEIAAEAQAFSSSLTQGFAVVTLLLFGWLLSFMGGQAYLVASAMCLAGIGAAYWSMVLRPAHSRAEGRRHVD